MNIKLVVSIVLAGLALVFIIQNTTVVEIRFLFWTLAMSRALFMFLMLGVGMVIGWLLTSYIRHRKGQLSSGSDRQ
jgi:uncharacterized integral membrane protein